MTSGIGRGFAEVQILKKVKFNSLTIWNILIKFCIHIFIYFFFAFTSFHNLSLLENTNNTKHFMHMREYFNFLTALIGCFGTQ